MIVELEEAEHRGVGKHVLQVQRLAPAGMADDDVGHEALRLQRQRLARDLLAVEDAALGLAEVAMGRSEEHTSELQSLMRISYAVFCLKNKPNTQTSKKPHT